MTSYIGDVAIPSVQEITISKSSDVDEPDFLNKNTHHLINGAEEVERMEIEFTLFETGVLEKSLDELEENVKSLPSIEASNNNFNHSGIVYLLSVEGVDVSEEGDVDNIREGSISAIAFPSPKHFEETPIVQSGDYGAGGYGMGSYGKLFDDSSEYSGGNYGSGSYGK